MAVDSAGTTFALDPEAKKVLSLAEGASSATVLPFGDDIDMSRRLVVDAAGSVYVADKTAVYKLGRGATRAKAVDFGTTDDGEPVFIADFAVDSHGTIFAVTDEVVAPNLPPNRVLELPVGAASPTGLPFHDIGRPDRIAVDGDGNVYVEDILNNRILMLSKGSDSEIVLPIAAPVRAMTVDTAGNVYTWDQTNNRVMELQKAATAQTVLPFHGLKTISDQITVDAKGAVYVPDSMNGRVLKWSPGAENATQLPVVFEPDYPGLFAPQRLAVDDDENVFIATSFNGIVLKLQGH